MKSIIIIIPYFGTLPNYFPLWLKSVEKNLDVNFLLITDDHFKYNYPSNVKVIYSEFECIKKRAREIFDFEIKLKSPYKLCEYKPFYNLIFEEEVKDYDFWGFCDIDLIFGNIRKFLTDDILEKYDKIYTRGHMTLFKNNKKINNIIMDHQISRDYYNYKEALTTNYICHFDEGAGITKIFKKHRIEQYEKVDYGDVYMKDYNFKLLFIPELKGKSGFFEWDNGKLEFVTDDGKRKELIYAHFQKRKMEINITNNSAEKYIIVPNEFRDYEEKPIINNKVVYLYYYKKRLNTILNNIKNGAIKQRIYRLKKRILYR